MIYFKSLLMMLLLPLCSYYFVIVTRTSCRIPPNQNKIDLTKLKRTLHQLARDVTEHPTSFCDVKRQRHQQREVSNGEVQQQEL